MVIRTCCFPLCHSEARKQCGKTCRYWFCPDNIEEHDCDQVEIKNKLSNLMGQMYDQLGTSMADQAIPYLPDDEEENIAQEEYGRQKVRPRKPTKDEWRRVVSK